MLSPEEANSWLKGYADQTDQPALRQEVVRALIPLAPNEAAPMATKLVADLSDVDMVSAWLTPWLQRQGATVALAKALTVSALSAETKSLIGQALATAGRTDPELRAALGIPPGVPEWSPEFVRQLIGDVHSGGNAERGKTIYE